MFANGVRFEVGKSDPAKDWPFIQPGTTDASAGSRERPQQIVFDLDQQLNGVYALRVDLVDVHSSAPPRMSISINDISQSFRLRPGVSDASLSDPANAREQIVAMYVRGQDLKVGENTVTLTLSRGSWVLYDCISFGRCAQPPKAVENLELCPKFLFKRGRDGLKQFVAASVDLFVGRDRVRAELVSRKGWRVEREFTDVPAGRSELEIEVPEVTEPQKAHLKVSVGKEVLEADGLIVPQKKWRIYYAVEPPRHRLHWPAGPHRPDPHRQPHPRPHVVPQPGLVEPSSRRTPGPSRYTNCAAAQGKSRVCAAHATHTRQLHRREP